MKYIILIWLFIPVLCLAQQDAKRDSILEVIRHAKTDTTKAKSYLSLGDTYLYSHQDTALKYYRKALGIAKGSGNKDLEAKSYNYIGVVYYYQSEFDQTVHYFEKSLKIKEEIGDKAGMANSYNNLGIIAKNRGNLGKALNYYDKVLEIRKELIAQNKDKELKEENFKKIGHVLMNIGNVQYQLGNFTEAIKSYENSLNNYDSINYKKGIAGCYNNIGSIFEEQENYDKAINYYKQALEISLALDEIPSIGTCYNNIGEVFLKKSDLVQARINFNKSLDYRKKTNNKRGVSAVYSNLGVVHMEEGSYDKALDMINKALKIDYQIDDKKGTAEDLNYLATIYLHQGEYKEAIDMAKQSLSISSSINIPLQSKESHKILSQAYEKSGWYKQALDEYKEFNKLEDKLFNKEKHKQIEELEQKYQAEKRQEKLKKQKAQLEKQEAVIKQQNTLRFVYIGGIITLILIITLIYWNYVQKRKANKILTEQKDEIEAKNEELQQQNEEIITQRDELEKQRDLANHQRNAIAIKNDEITSSIQYAKSIQAAVLPQDYHISRILKDFFILFKPKDIVSGDFYWVSEKQNKKIIAAVDCTGHGVPGAFMSLLGMSLLNDIVDEMRDIRANEILNILRTRMIQSLHQKGLSEENRDGMDIALVVWDQTKNEMQYSGAYNPLFLVRDGKLLEYKANRMTISIQSKLDQSFLNNKIEIQPGDTLYLATDGYPDQISGKLKKKMTKKRFKELLEKTAHKDLDEQKAELDKYFESWKGAYEQVDDVLLVGLRV